MLKLKAFQKRFLKAALDPSVDVAALSIARGNGKSALAGDLLARVLDPADVLFRAGTESVLLAASIEQARIVYRFVRAELEPKGGFRFLDSVTRCGITHTDTNTRLRIIGSNGRTAMGLVNCPWAICDEPGSWEVRGGALMWDALSTAIGKPGSPMKIVLIGTVAPSSTGWWPDLIEAGSQGSTYVQSIQGDAERWSEWGEIARCNPLWNVDARFRKRLLLERDEARRDTRLKSRFLSYRLNLPTSDESGVLLTVDDWNGLAKRAVPERQGSPIVGIDLGGGRAWSAAVAMWQSGRCEALAVAPGLPSIASQEQRDRVQAGTYAALISEGSLTTCEGLRVQPPGALWDAVLAKWGNPGAIHCDRFRLPELQDCVPGRIPIIPRLQRWSEGSFDIRALRKLTRDGPLAICQKSRALLRASLAVTCVKEDDAGSVRIIKRGSNNESRDDVSVALTLAAGAFQRASAQPVRKAYHGIA